MERADRRLRPRAFNARTRGARVRRGSVVVTTAPTCYLQLRRPARLPPGGRGPASRGRSPRADGPAGADTPTATSPTMDGLLICVATARGGARARQRAGRGARRRFRRARGDRLRADLFGAPRLSPTGGPGLAVVGSPSDAVGRHRAVGRRLHADGTGGAELVAGGPNDSIRAARMEPAACSTSSQDGRAGGIYTARPDGGTSTRARWRPTGRADVDLRTVLVRVTGRRPDRLHHVEEGRDRLAIVPAPGGSRRSDASGPTIEGLTTMDRTLIDRSSPARSTGREPDPPRAPLGADHRRRRMGIDAAYVSSPRPIAYPRHGRRHRARALVPRLQSGLRRDGVAEAAVLVEITAVTNT